MSRSNIFRAAPKPRHLEFGAARQREDEALGNILKTHGFGHPNLGRWLSRIPNETLIVWGEKEGAESGVRRAELAPSTYSVTALAAEPKWTTTHVCTAVRPVEPRPFSGQYHGSCRAKTSSRPLRETSLPSLVSVNRTFMPTSLSNMPASPPPGHARLAEP